MTQDFDKLITAAAPDLPDFSVDRRQARVLLHAQVRTARRRAGLRAGGPYLIWAASLAFLLLTTVQVGQLGSDGFEVQMGEIDLGNGQTVEVARNVFRGGGIGLPTDLSPDAVRTLQEAVAARDQEVIGLEGIAFNGGTAWWQVEFRTEIDGRVILGSRDAISLSEPSTMLSRDMMPFMVQEWEALLELVKSGQIPAASHAQLTADGIVFDVQSWSKEYPKWGEVTYYKGLPARQSDSRGQ